MTGKQALHGYLDRLRENLETLDFAIDDAKVMPKKGELGKARLKIIRDLIETRNATLEKIKVHLLGRDETGVPSEPDDIWDNEHSQVMFERYFNGQLEPWTRKDLELTCADCGIDSEEATPRDSDFNYAVLCDSCVEKRQAQNEDKEEVPQADLSQLFKWKKELEDAGVPPIKLDIPDPRELAEKLNALPPEGKARFIELCNQRGISLDYPQEIWVQGMNSLPVNSVGVCRQYYSSLCLVFFTQHLHSQNNLRSRIASGTITLLPWVFSQQSQALSSTVRLGFVCFCGLWCSPWNSRRHTPFTS